MPSFDRYQVFVTEDRAANRPQCVFSRRKTVQQSFRTFEFRDLSSEPVEEDVDRSREMAAEARLDFERELERRAAEAERRGQELGLQEAAQIHAEERGKLVERMEGAFDALNQALDRAEAAAAKDALRLGLMVAERISRVSLTENAAALAANLLASAEEMEGSEPLKVIVAPDFAITLRERMDTLTSELGVSGFEVESDDTLQPGDMMVFRGGAALDARIESRIRRIEVQLLRELGLVGGGGDEE